MNHPTTLAGILVMMALWCVTPAMAAMDPPPFTLAGTPAKATCRNCHAWRPPNLQRRTLTQPHHNHRLRHGPESLWCHDCHLAQQPDQLATPTPVPLAEAWRLCARCHGRQVREWRFGGHGKRMHFWNGERTLLHCPACHNPHAPAWPASTPAPPPKKPGTASP